MRLFCLCLCLHFCSALASEIGPGFSPDDRNSDRLGFSPRDEGTPTTTTGLLEPNSSRSSLPERSGVERPLYLLAVAQYSDLGISVGLQTHEKKQEITGFSPGPFDPCGTNLAQISSSSDTTDPEESQLDLFRLSLPKMRQQPQRILAIDLTQHIVRQIQAADLPTPLP
jgi:hypothetical protein